MALHPELFGKDLEIEDFLESAVWQGRLQEDFFPPRHCQCTFPLSMGIIDSLEQILKGSVFLVLGVQFSHQILVSTDETNDTATVSV